MMEKDTNWLRTSLVCEKIFSLQWFYVILTHGQKMNVVFIWKVYIVDHILPWSGVLDAETHLIVNVFIVLTVGPVSRSESHPKLG